MAAGEGTGAGPEGGQIGRFAITVGFELTEGAFETFHRLVSENAALSVEREPDCLRFDVLTPLEPGDGGSHVVLYEIYRDRAAFDRHLATSHYLSFDAMTRGIVRKKTVQACAVQENAKPGGAR